MTREEERKNRSQVASVPPRPWSSYGNVRATRGQISVAIFERNRLPTSLNAARYRSRGRRDIIEARLRRHVWFARMQFTNLMKQIR